MSPAGPVCEELLRLLAWVPAKRFTPRLANVARLCWCWAWAAGGAELQASGGWKVFFPGIDFF